MNKLGITQGAWNYETTPSGNETNITNGEYRIAEAKHFAKQIHPRLKEPQKEQGIANAKLIAEAGTVSNETGLSPRQLKEQRDDLLTALKSSVNLGLATYGEAFKEWVEYKTWSELINNCENTLK